MNDKLLTSTEIEDFETVCNECGVEKIDFDISEKMDPAPTDGHIFQLTGVVTIQHKSTKKSKIYSAGYGTSWPNDFRLDLNGGFFN